MKLKKMGPIKARVTVTVLVTVSLVIMIIDHSLAFPSMGLGFIANMIWIWET